MAAGLSVAYSEAAGRERLAIAGCGPQTYPGTDARARQQVADCGPLAYPKPAIRDRQQMADESLTTPRIMLDDESSTVGPRRLSAVCSIPAGRRRSTSSGGRPIGDIQNKRIIAGREAGRDGPSPETAPVKY